MRLAAFVLGVWLLTYTSALAFDCANAKLPWDIVVCSDPELQRLADQRLEAFMRAKPRLNQTEVERLQKEQAAWVHSYSASCGIPR